MGTMRASPFFDLRTSSWPSARSRSLSLRARVSPGRSPAPYVTSKNARSRMPIGLLRSQRENHSSIALRGKALEILTR